MQSPSWRETVGVVSLLKSPAQSPAHVKSPTQRMTVGA